MKKTLLLIDGSSFIFRAFHAMPNLTAPEGKPTGATYGIINMLKQMQKKYVSILHWGCVFDTPHETFREKLYPQYKAHRAETPPELMPQFEDIYQLVKALGIPIIIKEGIEADDVIGTIAVNATKKGFNVLIATGDKDFAQLVNDDITLINTMTDELLDHNGVVNKFGVKPTQIIDYLTLVGDKADNVPGVDKCGPKTAVKWLTQYHTLDNIIVHQNDISGVVGENLRGAVPWLATAKTLVTIDTKVELNDIITNGIDDLTLQPANYNQLVECYTRLGFKNWLKKLDANNLELQDTNKHNHKQITHQEQIHRDIASNYVTTITSCADLDKLVNAILRDNDMLAPRTALVIVPNNTINPAYLRYVFIAQNNQTYVIDLGNSSIAETHNTSHDLFTNNQETSAVNNGCDFTKLLRKFLASDIAKVVANYKDTLQLCTKLNLELNNVVGDLNLLHYIKDSKESHAITHVFKEYLNLEVENLPSINPKSAAVTGKQLDGDQNLLINNCTQIVANLVSLEEYICEQLDQNELHLYKEIELPLAKILVKIEATGITLDIAKFKIIETEISTQLHQLEQKIYQGAQCVFNINSPKQLQDVLFNQLKLPTAGIKKNTSGYSTDEATLTTLATQNILIANSLLEYRTLSKLLNTYIAKLPKLIDSKNKIHTIFEQALVASGRLSSHDPNLQNIPIKSEWGRRIRQCFIADADHVLICADYSQIELRVLAHISEDPNLVNAFNNNQDIHAITASEIFHKTIDEITTNERRYAKTINFSLLYGKTAYGLANELGIDIATAKKYIDAYFAKFPKVLLTLENIKQQARENGFVTTVFGRRIYLPNIKSHNKIIREAEERLALNAPMQGTSADIIKIAMCNIETWLTANKLQTRMILQVHDELILQVPQSEIDIITTNLDILMTKCITQLSVHLAVNIKTAQNWDEAH